MSSLTGPTITNIIVVMLENRSYDNILGWLYNPSNQPPYNQAPAGQANLNGLTGNETNPSPEKGGDPIAVMNQSTTTDGKTGKSYPGTAVPLYDPGELFKDMAQQIVIQEIHDDYVKRKPQPDTANRTRTKRCLGLCRLLRYQRQ
ncbi:MAG TPA: alkaline phosphatase family protein [Pyrinomonadaceae bacterium]|nr:alkaline phosphatase family protein [Pyrinomonadaceae bacterium]